MTRTTTLTMAVLLLVAGCAQPPTTPARKNPGHGKKLDERFRQLVAKQFEVSPDAIAADEPLMGPKLNADELDIAELIMGAEDLFDAAIRDEDIEKRLGMKFPEAHKRLTPYIIQELAKESSAVRALNPPKKDAPDQGGAAIIAEEKTPAIGPEGTLAEAIGIETLGGVFTPLLEIGTAVPCQKSETFSTAADNQTQILIQLYRGSKRMVKDNVRLGRFQVQGIPAAPRGSPNIEVSFIVTKTDILLEAKDLSSGKNLPIVRLEAGVKGDTSSEAP